MRYPLIPLGLVSMLVAACSDNGPAAPEPVAVAQVALTSPVTELELGDSAQVAVTVTASDGSALTDRAVTWTSDDPSVLRVSATGVVTGVGGGRTRVTATVESRAASVSVTVHPWNIAEHAIVIDSTSLRLVSDSAERASGRLRFHLEQGSAPSFAAGMVVVGAQDGGFLRRVTSAAVSGSDIELQTEPAAVADIVEAGGFASTVNLISAAGVPSSELAAAVAALPPGQVIWGEGRFTDVMPGARLVPAAGAAAFGEGRLASFDLGGVDVCELVKELSSGATTCPDQLSKFVIKNGLLDFEPDMTLEASFSGFSLDEFRGTVEGTLELDVLLDLEAKGSLGSFAAKPTFFTFTRPFYAQIGPVPVVGYVELAVTGELSLKATAKGAMEAGYEASGTVEIGASYDGSWEPIVEGSGTFEPRIPSFADGTLKGNVEFEAKLSMKPRAQIIFYGVIGPFAEAEPFGTATLTLGTSCGLTTNMAVNAAYGFTIPFLDSKVGDFSNDVKPLIQGPQSDWQCPLGTIDVNTTTSGAGAATASAGFSVWVDGEDRGVAPATGQLMIPLVQVGAREVVLTGVPPNCEVAGGTTRAVAVATGNVHGVDFVIDCTALTGEIEVTTHTTGAAPDPDGYTLGVGGASFAIGANETLTVENVREGTALVTLAGLESNCEMAGASSVEVQVVADETTQVGFDINCAATELVVRTSTTGPPASAAGWNITLDGADNRTIAPNGQVTYTTTPGQHNVALNGLPENCASTGPNPVVVDAAGAGATEHTFTIQCEGAGLNVTVTTDGDPDPATGYTVSAGGESENIGINGSAFIGNLPAGSTSVLLGGLPDHCTVQGLNPRTADVPGSATFEVVCQQPLQCPADPPEAGIIDTTDAWVSDGGTYEAVTEFATWGHVAGRISTASTADALGPGVTTELGWYDRFALVPVDSSDTSRFALLRADVTGSITVFGSDPENSGVHTHFSTGYGCPGCPISFSKVTDERRFSEDGSGTFTTSAVAYFITRIGDWDKLEAYMAINVGPDFDGSMSSSEASLRIDRLIDVVDANTFQPIAVREICTASGHTY